MTVGGFSLGEIGVLATMVGATFSVFFGSVCLALGLGYLTLEHGSYTKEVGAVIFLGGSFFLLGMTGMVLVGAGLKALFP